MSASTLTLSGLFAHKEHTAVDEFIRVLKPGIIFTSFEQAPSLEAAFQLVLRAPFDVCFVQAVFQEGIDAFFHDMHLLENGKDCVFVQLISHRAKDFDPEPALKAGFAAVISEVGTAEDRSSLAEVLQRKYHRQEVTQRACEVEGALSILLRKIDTVASDRQRGRNTPLPDRAVSGFIADQIEFDQKILGSYFDSLSAKSEEAPPAPAKELAVPQAVLKKKLPHLTARSYTGASERVWKKLVKRFGVSEPTEDEAPPQGDEAPPPKDK